LHLNLLQETSFSKSSAPAFKCHRMPLVAQAAAAIVASSATSSLAQAAATMAQAAGLRTPLAFHPRMIIIQDTTRCSQAQAGLLPLLCLI
jgi:hypothetical protein